jgi:hypothetical protein
MFYIILITFFSMNLFIFKSSMRLIGLVTTATLFALVLCSGLKAHAKVCEEVDDPILFI